MKFAWFCMEMNHTRRRRLRFSHVFADHAICWVYCRLVFHSPELSFYRATDRIINVSHVRSTFEGFSSHSVSVVNKKTCKLTYQIKSPLFQDPLMVVNFFGLTLELLLFSGFRYVHFLISTCNHSLKQDQKL